MTHLEAVLVARSYRDGVAYRTAGLRHAHLVPRPIVVLGWQLGAEPFTAAALAFGCHPDGLNIVVAGEPRNRDLAFAALLEFAAWFNPLFEAAIATREPLEHNHPEWTIACQAPQLVVPNRLTVEFLGRIGRRLAYLNNTTGKSPDPQLIRLGQHLQFLERHASVPGQQLVVALTELLGAHWVTPQTEFERQSLPALDAYIEPPPGMNGFEASAIAERRPVGPVVDAQTEVNLEATLRWFNEARRGRTDRATVTGLLPSIRAHYAPLIRYAWELAWRCLKREMDVPEAPSPERRWLEDRKAYTSHVDWMAQGGRRRARQSARQAAMTLRRLEEAKRLLLAEEAIDDPVRMIPYLLEQKAVEGMVTNVNTEYREVVNVKEARRPLVTLVSSDPCLIPQGRELWWTDYPHGAPWIVEEVTARPNGGSQVTLKLTTSSLNRPLPREGDVCCFSVHTLDVRWKQRLPNQEPWTHRGAVAEVESLEESA